MDSDRAGFRRKESGSRVATGTDAFPNSMAHGVLQQSVAVALSMSVPVLSPNSQPPIIRLHSLHTNTNTELLGKGDRKAKVDQRGG